MRKKICIALMAAFTVLLGVSSYFIIDHYREAEHQEQMYDSLVQLVEDSETEPVEPIIYSEDKTILPELTELYRQNNDLVGWICMEDTNINYPVMQTVDNPNYYLKRGFDKEYSSYGCPYVQEDCDVLKPSDNLVIYGHHMNNGTMFADLCNYASKAYRDAHPTVVIETKDGVSVYTVFSVMKVKSDDDWYRFTSVGKEKSYNSMIEYAKEKSIYDTGITPAYNQQILTLSTCYGDSNDGRILILAVKN